MNEPVASVRLQEYTWVNVLFQDVIFTRIQHTGKHWINSVYYLTTLSVANSTTCSVGEHSGMRDLRVEQQ